MRKHCPVCGGKGTINDPKAMTGLVSYSGPNGELAPQMSCVNCGGAGFVGVPDYRGQKQEAE